MAHGVGIYEKQEDNWKLNGDEINFQDCSTKK